MASISLTYLGDLRSEATHDENGKKLLIDLSKEKGGKGEYFAPTELLATSLASCILSIMGVSANVHGFDIKGTTVKATRVVDADPKKITAIQLVFTFPKNNYTDKEKQLLQAAAKSCPVGHSILPEVKQDFTLNF